jgi:hypothetical protein
VAGDGGTAGAVYEPPDEIAPQAAPAHPEPETDHEIARLGFELATGTSVATKLAVVPELTDVGPLTVSENELVRVIEAAPLLDGSAMLMAWTETMGGAVSTCGAVYVPVGSTVPHAAPAHPFPEMTQLRARSGLPAELTVAMNGRAAPSSTGNAWGETETDMSLVTVTAAVALLELSATLVACTVTESGTGRSLGDV